MTSLYYIDTQYSGGSASDPRVGQNDTPKDNINYPILSIHVIKINVIAYVCVRACVCDCVCV